MSLKGIIYGCFVSSLIWSAIAAIILLTGCTGTYNPYRAISNGLAGVVSVAQTAQPQPQTHCVINGTLISCW